MRIFDKFNPASTCLICRTNKEGKAVLLPDYSTEKDGTCEAIQVHLECLDLAIDERREIIYQFIGDKITKYTTG